MTQGSSSMMNPGIARRRFLKAVAAATLWAGRLPAEGASRPGGQRRPNIIFILADDLGWAELGCYGNTFNETPNLDKLAGDGMRFTQAYAAAPVCSPYRASLMTGQYPVRTGITDYLRPNDAKHLSTDYVTLPKVLKGAGYATGLVGKWHLTGYANHGAQEIGPGEHGFDEVIVSENRDIADGSYFFPYQFNRGDPPASARPGVPRGPLQSGGGRVHRAAQGQALLPVPEPLRGAHAAQWQAEVGRQVRGQAERGQRPLATAQQPALGRPAREHRSGRRDDPRQAPRARTCPKIRSSSSRATTAAKTE